MTEYIEKLTTALSDAGFSRDDVEKAGRLIEAGCTDDFIRYLRICRCDLMDDMHKTQRRVDRLDNMIRQAEKTLTQK